MFVLFLKTWTEVVGSLKVGNIRFEILFVCLKADFRFVDTH